MEPLNHYAQSHCDLPFRSAISGDWATPGMVPAEGFFYSRVSFATVSRFRLWPVFSATVDDLQEQSQ
jgi:hypothetical protein